MSFPNPLLSVVTWCATPKTDAAGCSKLVVGVGAFETRIQITGKASEPGI
jgi:hypothetical protein